MNKIERISAILVKLQSRSCVTAQQVADQFGVSLRTVYRDIRVLEEAGIPIVANAGEGYSLVDGYKLPPLMFTTEEAIAFLLAEKVFELQSGDGLFQLYRNGMDKIRAVLRVTDKETLEHFDSHINTVDFQQKSETVEAPVFHPLIRSIVHKKAVRITYTANYNLVTVEREIEPVGIFFMGMGWYLIAWCRLRKDYRTFHLGRISRLLPTDSGFSRSHGSLKQLLDSMHLDKEMYTVRLKVCKSALREISARKLAYGLQTELVEGDNVIQVYSTFSLEYFARWYLTFADQAEILAPVALKEVVVRLIRDIQQRMDISSDGI